MIKGRVEIETSHGKQVEYVPFIVSKSLAHICSSVKRKQITKVVRSSALRAPLSQVTQQCT